MFKSLTQEQLKRLKINSKIQRGDTVLLNSNIRNYSRLSLLVEVLRRLEKILSSEDIQKCSLWLSPYRKGGEKYVYEVKSSNYEGHLEKLAQSYYTLNFLL